MEKKGNREKRKGTTASSFLILGEEEEIRQEDFLASKERERRGRERARGNRWAPTGRPNSGRTADEKGNKKVKKCRKKSLMGGKSKKKHHQHATYKRERRGEEEKRGEGRGRGGTVRPTKHLSHHNEERRSKTLTKHSTTPPRGQTGPGGTKEARDTGERWVWCWERILWGGYHQQ